MSRLEITIHNRGHERRFELRRSGAIIAAMLLVPTVVGLLAVALLFGYLVFGVVLVVLLIGIAVAMIRGVFVSFRREAWRPSNRQLTSSHWNRK